MPHWSPILHGFHQSFLGITRRKEHIPADLQRALDKLKALHKELAGVENMGKSCLRQAKWIGFDRYVTMSYILPVLNCWNGIYYRSNEKNRETQMGLHMVETEQLKRKGMKSGVLSKEDKDASFLTEDGWHRMCAPKAEEDDDKPGKMHALIFWHKSHSNETPSWEKQVSGFCHFGPFDFPGLWVRSGGSEKKTYLIDSLA